MISGGTDKGSGSRFKEDIVHGLIFGKTVCDVYIGIMFQTILMSSHFFLFIYLLFIETDVDVYLLVI